MRLTCACTVTHFTPAGLPLSTEREVASTRPSGAWPLAAMPSRILRIISAMSLPTGQTIEQRPHMVQLS
jgi:hypothetical protein